MPLTLEETAAVARLARLQLTEDEVALYREQLSSILDYATRLNNLDTADISPTFSILPPLGALREDEPQPGLDIEKVLQNAARTEGRRFKVPSVLDK
jgi:aspartyl-tRNA(Asn)/glutamyl-tRNA(Gln) amidotransferase subunit C